MNVYDVCVCDECIGRKIVHFYTFYRTGKTTRYTKALSEKFEISYELMHG